MVASYYAGTIPTAEGIEQLDDEMLSLFGYSTNSDNGTDAGDNGTEPTGYDLATLAIDYFHLSDSHRYANWTIPQLQQELANGYPVIIAVFTHMNPADGYHKHFMVLVGMDDNFVYVNDPGRTWQQTHAGPLAYTIGAFQTAWKENAGNAVVVIHPNAPIPPLSPTWSHFTPSGTGPTLNGNPPVYDPGSNRLIMYGGLLADNSCCTSDTWVLMNANGLGGMPQWQQLSPAGSLPPTRVGHSAVYDATNNRMIIFGGGQQGGCGVYCVLFNDVWVLSNANGVAGPPTWRQLIPSAPNGYPAPRAAHLAIYDPTTNRVIIFGGGNNGTGDRNDTWVLTNANGLGGTPEWVPLSPAGSLPAPREIAVGSYDPIVSAMTLFGGVPGFLGDLWILSRANGLGGAPAWQQISQTSPSPGTLANWNYGYDSATNTLLFFGGSPSYGVFRNDFWILRNANGVGAPTWINTIPANSPGSPPPSVPLGTYDAIHNRFMIVPDAADLWVLTKANDSQ